MHDHLKGLSERWAVWRWAGLRSAGFPIDGVLALASPECAAAADRCLNGDCDERRAEYARAFDAAVLHAATALREVAGDRRFREALAWQNRRALHAGVESLRHRPAGLEGRNSRQRQNEAMVTSYVQRYCAKNDTIGFFGPVGWARLVDEGPPLAAEPGPALLAARSTYFEGWCVDTLGQTLAQELSLLPWLSPRPMPYVRLEGSALHPPLAPPVPLGPVESAAFQACDGVRTAREVAALLLADPALGLTSEQDVFAVLGGLRDARWIAWTLEVPAEGLHPERSLRRLLEGVADEPARAAALRRLEELVRSQRAVAASAGDPEAVDRALGALDETFVRLTAAAPTRRDGESYSGRTLVYEDCRRDVDVRLGPGLLEALGPPLSLVLAAAAWLTAEAADLFRAAFQRSYAELARKAGPRVPFASFWFLVHPLVFGEGRVVETMTRRLRQRWGAVLDLPAGERRVAFDVEALRPRVAVAFPARPGAWASARYHSPDVLIAAGGDGFDLVLGEVHPATNTLRPAFFSAQHPAPDELLRAVERDLPGPQVVPVFSRGRGGATLRISRSLVSPRDYRLVFAADTCGVPAGRALPIAALDVRESAGGLDVEVRGGGPRFDVMDVLGDLITFRVLHAFEIAPRAGHTPRIDFGRLTVCRETWRVPAGGLAWAAMADERARFLAARAWMGAEGMPRFVFVRAQAGDKPQFLDFDSPFSVDVAARALRKAAASSPDAPVTVTEMLPAPDGLWLTDAAGSRYASELRMVAVDRAPAPGQPA